MVSNQKLEQLTYDAAIQSVVSHGNTVTVSGIIIDRTSSRIAGPRGCFPIFWCLCVMDSPDNPCPCNGPVVWIPNTVKPFKTKLAQQPLQIRRGSDPTAATSEAGKPVAAKFEIPTTMQLFIDDCRPLEGKHQLETRLLRMSPDGLLSPVEERLWIQEFTPMQAGRLQRALEVIENNPKLSVLAKKKGKGFWAKLVAAFEAGYAMGEELDEEFGLSDSLSDWMLDTFGSWD